MDEQLNKTFGAVGGFRVASFEAQNTVNQMNKTSVSFQPKNNK